MASITTRETAGTGATVKNLPLSNSEIDTNFININTSKLEITDTTESNTANKVVKRDSSGNFAAGTITATAFTETSSIALKENISPINNALSSILSLNGVVYDRKDGSRKNEAGLIAEEVYQILPNLIGTDKEGKPESVNYSKLTAYLIEAVKELKLEIDSLKGMK